MVENKLITKLEIWKPIPDIPGYEVSNMGRVRSFWIWGHSKIGDSHRIMAPYLYRKSLNYARFCIDIRKEQKRVHAKVHNLVLIAFRGPCPNGMEGCHTDGNGLNNNIDNLRWDIPQNNILDSIYHGTRKRKLNAEKVIEMRERWENKESIVSLAASFGIAKRNVSMVVHKKAWRHII
jgi:hypothetical protein